MATNVEKIRIMIGDLVPPRDAEFYTNTNIEAALEIAENNLFHAASILLRGWASALEEESMSYKLTDTKSVDTRDKARVKLELAKTYEESALKFSDPLALIINNPVVVDDAGQDWTGITTWDEIQDLYGV